jgi:uncharacterized membrane protein YeaQ/YmgE (transglycosylase-associated protein family)
MSTVGAVIAWVFFGLVIGLIGRLLVPGRQPLGWLGTIGLGIVGSFAGGFLTYLFRGGEPLQAAGVLMSVVGAAVVLAIYISIATRRVR